MKASLSFFYYQYQGRGKNIFVLYELISHFNTLSKVFHYCFNTAVFTQSYSYTITYHLNLTSATALSKHWLLLLSLYCNITASRAMTSCPVSSSSSGLISYWLADELSGMSSSHPNKSVYTQTCMLHLLPVHVRFQGRRFSVFGVFARQTEAC